MGTMHGSVSHGWCFNGTSDDGQLQTLPKCARYLLAQDLHKGRVQVWVSFIWLKLNSCVGADYAGTRFC